MSNPTNDEYTAFESWLRKRWGGSDRGELTRQSNGAGYVNGKVDFAFAAYRSGLAATPAPAIAAGVPAGCVQVPANPTDDMFIAGMEADCAGRPSVDDEAHVRSIWAAMLAAAPQAPVADQPAEPSPVDPRMVSVVQEDANRFCEILTLLGMEDEGDPVAEVQRLQDRAAHAIWSIWESLPGYLIDHCEGEIVSEEMLQRALEAMLKDPKYAAPKGDSNG